MASEIFTRELKDFGGSLWSMKNQRKFCDASIIVGNQRVGVHTIILASSSEFFENAFKNTDLAIKEVVFDDVDTETLLGLVEYCYTGSIIVTESNINEVFKMAKILSMKSIVDNSSKILKKLINVENSMSMWRIVKSGNSETLMSVVLGFIRQNFEKVSLLKEFLDLEYSDMKELLDEDVDVGVVAAHKALKKWKNHEISRTNYFVDLLDQIKLERFPRYNLLTESQSACNSNGNCFMKSIEVSPVENLQFINDDSEKRCLINYNTLIATGDFDVEISKIIEIFDLEKNKWIEIQYDGLKADSFSAILTQDKLMVIGGCFENNSLDTILCYNLNTGHEECLPPMKYSRYFSSAVKYGEHVYVIGGIQNYHSVPYVERWDENSKTWTTVAPMANPRSKFGVAIFGNEIFVVGGKGNSGTLAEVEAYDPITDRWRRITPMNERREGHGVTVVGGFLYAVAGRNESGKLKTAEKYDPNIEKWTMIQSIATMNRGLATENLNGQLVVTGGWTDSKRVSTVKKYDEVTNEWLLMPSLKNSRYYHNLLQIPWNLAKDVLSRRASE